MVNLKIWSTTTICDCALYNHTFTPYYESVYKHNSGGRKVFMNLNVEEKINAEWRNTDKISYAWQHSIKSVYFL